MTPIEYADKLRLALITLQQTNRPLVLAATSATSEMATRIFVEGKASDNNPIGKYNDTKIIYLNPDKPYVFSGGELRNALGTFENGKKRKTVKTTYKGYKSLLGKPKGGAFVNLELSGDLKSDLTNTAPIGEPSTVLERVSNDEYLVKWKSEINALKAEGKEGTKPGGFGKKIFKLTASEKQTVFRVAEFHLRELFA